MGRRVRNSWLLVALTVFVLALTAGFAGITSADGPRST
jgi:hypothetical protein